MKLFGQIVSAISDHPGLFLFLRGVVENDFAAIRSVIRDELRPAADRRTLDLGCGPGAFSDLFWSEGYLGVDINPRYIAYARRHYRGAFLAGDARHLDLPDGRFDQVLVFGLLHHLGDTDSVAVLQEVRRLLAPQGSALAIEDIPAVSRLNLLGHLIHWAENGDHIRPVEDYRRLYSSVLRVERDQILRSGICDYYAAVLRH